MKVDFQFILDLQRQRSLKCQPSHTDIVGCGVMNSLVNELSFGRFNDGERKGNGRLSPVGFPPLHDDIATYGDGHVPIVGSGDLDNLCVSVIQDRPGIPVLDTHLLSFLKRVL